VKQRSLKVLISIGFIALCFALYELILTSKLDLRINFSFYPSLDRTTQFRVYLKNGDEQQQHIITPESAVLSLKGLKIDRYMLTVTLDNMDVYTQELEFDRTFDFLRRTENLNVSIGELSTVTYLETQIDDPLLRVKWQVKNSKDFIPTQFEVGVNGNIEKLNVNYVEIDIRKLLKTADDTLSFSISPLSHEGHRLDTFTKTLSVRLANLKINLPPQIDPFETSVRVGTQTLQIDPYTSQVAFPYLSDVVSVPVEVLYYRQSILTLNLKPEALLQPLSLPPVPAATITAINVAGEGVQLNFALDNPKEATDFLRDAFKYFWIQGDTYEATTLTAYTIPATTASVELFVIPQFDYGVQGRATKFIKSAKPTLQVALTGQKNNQTMRALITGSTDEVLRGRYKVDKLEWVDLPPFERVYELAFPISFDQIHSLEIVVQDPFGQTGEYKKWVDPSIPQTTYFKKASVEASVLKVEWEPLTVYNQIVVTVTDGYNKITLTPQESYFETDISKTALFYPLKVIIKGRIGEELYTCAIEENIYPSAK
jgi:hypothetical protein